MRISIKKLPHSINQTFSEDSKNSQQNIQTTSEPACNQTLPTSNCSPSNISPKSNASQVTTNSSESTPIAVNKEQSSSLTTLVSCLPTTQNSLSNNGKSFRKNLWTTDDTRWFFEALCEHGKDFTQIQSYISARCEKKGKQTDSIKNYEQVRNFYYRMWHRIFNMMNFCDRKFANSFSTSHHLFSFQNSILSWKKVCKKCLD